MRARPEENPPPSELVPFLEAEGINEILVNGGGEVWVDSGGSLAPAGCAVPAESLAVYVRGALAQVGRKVDRRQPFADARLPDGSRLCVATEPAALGGMHVCIRRFPRRRQTLAQLEAGGSMSAAAGELLRKYVSERKNILIAGATGSGKTTLLNALASLAPKNERILTLEDVAELALDHPHVVSLECRPANLEGEGEISLRMLLRTALRMRPDRLVLGECRGEEAVDLLQALHTGHGGSMSTIHANSAREALNRLQMLALSGGANLQESAVRAYIAAAVDAVIFLERAGGVRRVTAVQEVSGVEGHMFLLRPREI